MKTPAITVFALLVAALSLAPAAQASDRYDSGDRHAGHRDRHDHGYHHHRGHQHWQHNRHHWHNHGARHHDHYYGRPYYKDHRVQVIIPLPVPPYPVVVLDQHRYGH